MLLYAHALLDILTKEYHKVKPTSSTANIKVKYSLPGYKTKPDATSCACVVGNHPKRVPQA